MFCVVIFHTCYHDFITRYSLVHSEADLRLEIAEGHCYGFVIVAAFALRDVIAVGIVDAVGGSTCTQLDGVAFVVDGASFAISTRLALTLRDLHLARRDVVFLGRHGCEGIAGSAIVPILDGLGSCADVRCHVGSIAAVVDAHILPIIGVAGGGIGGTCCVFHHIVLEYEVSLAGFLAASLVLLAPNDEHVAKLSVSSIGLFRTNL